MPRGGKDARCHQQRVDRKSTRLNSSHDQISYAVFCLKKKRLNSSHDQISYAVFCLKKKLAPGLQPQTIRYSCLHEPPSRTHLTTFACPRVRSIAAPPR